MRNKAATPKRVAKNAPLLVRPACGSFRKLRPSSFGAEIVTHRATALSGRAEAQRASRDLSALRIGRQLRAAERAKSWYLLFWIKGNAADFDPEKIFPRQKAGPG